MDRDIPQALRVRRTTNPPTAVVAVDGARVICEFADTLGRDVLARRMVAAYNATRDISVEALEEPPVLDPVTRLEVLASAVLNLPNVWTEEQAPKYRSRRNRIARELKTASDDIGALIAAVEKWIGDGSLQTFEDRQRFRDEMRALLARCKGETL